MLKTRRWQTNSCLMPSPLKLILSDNEFDFRSLRDVIIFISRKTLLAWVKLQTKKKCFLIKHWLCVNIKHLLNDNDLNRRLEHEICLLV